jgi:hypothetical protein
MGAQDRRVRQGRDGRAGGNKAMRPHRTRIAPSVTKLSKVG